MLGTVFDRIPVVGYFSLVVGAGPIWFVVVALAGAALAGWTWRGPRRRLGIALVVIGIVAALGAALVTARMVHAVSAAGAHVSVVQTFGLGSPSKAHPDDEPVYLTDHGDALKVDVYRSHPAGGAPAPVLLYVHGGGWTGGDRHDHSADMRWFADHGWLVLSIDYSLSSADRHLWDVTQGQVGCALSWVSSHAATYGGDASRLSLTGDSAGGNLAINTAYLDAAGHLPSACGGTAPPVHAVSVLYPVVSVEGIYETSALGRRFATSYVGGSPAELPDRYAAVDSTPTINADAPPTLVLTGDSDHIVDVKDVDAFVQKARDGGIEVKYVTVPYADHAFDTGPGSIGQQAYRQLTQQWLVAHGQQP